MPTTSGEFTCPHCKSKVSASITLPSSATSRPAAYITPSMTALVARRRPSERAVRCIAARCTPVVRRAGADDFTLALTRDTIRRQLLRWRMEGSTLVLRLSSFTGPVSTALADAVAEASATTPPQAVVLDLRGNPGGLIREAVRVAEEVFADRTYTDAGFLTPRKEPNSMIKDAAQAVAHVRRMVDEQAIYSTSGKRIPCQGNTSGMPFDKGFEVLSIICRSSLARNPQAR